VLFGYGGIRLTSEAMTFDPQLPPSVTNVKFGEINYMNNKLRVVFDENRVTVTKTNNVGVQLYLKTHTGNQSKITQNEPITFVRGSFSLFTQ